MGAAHCGQRVMVAVGDKLGEVNIRMRGPSNRISFLFHQTQSDGSIVFSSRNICDMRTKNLRRTLHFEPTLFRPYTALAQIALRSFGRTEAARSKRDGSKS